MGKQAPKDSRIRTNIGRGFAKAGWAGFVSSYRKLERNPSSATGLSDELKGVADVYDLYDLHPWSRLPEGDVHHRHKPVHFDPIVQRLQGCVGSRLRLLLSSPPQHEKTTTLFFVLAFLLLKHPGRRHLYVSYNDKRAHDAGDVLCEEVLRPLGVPFSYVNGTLSCNGGSVRFVGVGSSITGYTCDGLCVLDDLVKNAEEGRSPRIQEKTATGYDRNIKSRGWGDVSIVVVMTRWDVRDLIGTLSKEVTTDDPWTYLNFKAVIEDDEDASNDPIHRNVGQYLLDFQRRNVDAARSNASTFYAMYQGEPTVPAMRLFDEPQTYDRLPSTANVVFYGFDSAYSRGKGDYTVLIRGLLDRSTGLVYLTHVVRGQWDMEGVADACRPVVRGRPGPIRWYYGGQEHATAARYYRANGMPRLECLKAVGQLKIRAQATADAWNAGLIKVPAVQDEAAMAFVEEVTTFTGDDRAHDDCVAALHGLFGLTNAVPFRDLTAGQQADAGRNVAPELSGVQDPFRLPGSVRDRLQQAHRSTSFF